MVGFFLIYLNITKWHSILWGLRDFYAFGGFEWSYIWLIIKITWKTIIDKTSDEDICIVPLTSQTLLPIISPGIFGAPSDGKNVLRGVQNRIPHCISVCGEPGYIFIQKFWFNSNQGDLAMCNAASIVDWVRLYGLTFSILTVRSKEL